METKFTPPPWLADRTCVRNGGEQHRFSCGLTRTAYAKQEEMYANASLIAAAPTLYGAGERLANVADDKLATISETVEAINAMRAALALARGETSQPESRVGLGPDAGTRQPNQEKSS